MAPRITRAIRHLQKKVLVSEVQLRGFAIFRTQSICFLLVLWALACVLPLTVDRAVGEEPDAQVATHFKNQHPLFHQLRASDYVRHTLESTKPNSIFADTHSFHTFCAGRGPE